MTDVSGTTIDDLVAALKSRRAPLPFEIGAFVALSVCEALASAPVVVNGKDVRVAQDGSVSVSAAPRGGNDEASARSIVALLAQLLVAAGPSVPPRLLALVECGPSDGGWCVARVRDELAAALVPLNRSASRRVLARLVRESVREQRPGVASSPPAGVARGALDDELDSLFERSAASRGLEAAQEQAASAEDLLATLPGGPAPEVESERDAEFRAERESASAPEAEPEPAREPEPESESEVESALEAEAESAREPEPEPERVRAPVAPRVVPDRVSLDGLEDGGRGKGGLVAVVAMVGLLLAVAGGVYYLRPAWFGLAPRSAGSVEPAGRVGELFVRSVPVGAQVLIYVGRGPAVAKDLPVGVAQDFVVIADGKASARAVVAADADWETTPDGPRYEIALSAGDEDVAFDALDLGVPSVARGPRGGGRERGEVRIVTAPRGAKVYRLVGLTPDVRIARLPTDEAVELLVFARGYAPQRLVIGPSDWRQERGERVAEVSATLVARPASPP